MEDLSTKIEWAKAECPDHFLLMTSSYLAPTTRAWLTKIREQVQFHVHVLEGKELRQRVVKHPDIIARYFLDDQQTLIKDIKRQWVYHTILPDAASFHKIFRNLNVSKMSGEDLAFMLMMRSQLDEKLNELCETEDLEALNDNSLLLELRRHKNHFYPLLSDSELKSYHLTSLDEEFTCTTTVEGTDIFIFRTYQLINHDQHLNVLVKREDRCLDVRISLRE